MGNSGSLPQDQHFVVVGGGYGGVAVARGFRDSHCKFTLISDRDCFHHNVAAVRAAVTKGYAKKTLLPLKEIFGENFKLGRVVGIDAANKKLRLESGEEVGYDVLIIATGTTGNFPNKLASQDSQTATVMYEEIAARVEKAGRILVIGGGATGTEQACEIATKYPEKQVTLVAARDYLITDKANASFQAKLLAILERLGIKVIKGEQIPNIDELDLTQDGPFSVTTDKGTTLEADLVLKCTGLRINSDAYRDSLGNAVDDHGQLKVNPYLQVEGHEDIYAIGDCSSNEDKLAYAAMEECKLLLSNLKNKNSGKPMQPWNPDKAIPMVTVVALGPTSGLGQLKAGYILPEFLIRSLKSKDLFIPRTWKENGLSVPK